MKNTQYTMNAQTSQNTKLATLFANMNKRDTELMNECTTNAYVDVVANILSYPIQFVLVVVWSVCVLFLNTVQFVYAVVITIIMNINTTCNMLWFDMNTRCLVSNNDVTVLYERSIMERIKKYDAQQQTRRNERNKRNA
jgi:hypothetical protein